MNWYQPKTGDATETGHSNADSSSSSLRPDAVPAPDPFPPSQRYHEPHERREKRLASDTATGKGKAVGDAEKRRRLLLAMDDWTGTKFLKPLSLSFPHADRDAPAWGWSGEAEVADKENHGPRSGSGSYSVKKYSPAKYSLPSSSSTLNAQPSRQSWQTTMTPLRTLRSSPDSRPVSGTLSEEERQRFESNGVGILSPSGQTDRVGSTDLDLPMMSGALPAPVQLPTSQPSAESPHSSSRAESRESSLDRERTPSDVPEDILLGSEMDSEGHQEEEEQEVELDGAEDEGSSEEDASQHQEGCDEETEAEIRGVEHPSRDPEEDKPGEEVDNISPQQPDPASSCDVEDVQLVPTDGQAGKARRGSQLRTHRPVPTLARDTSNLSEAGRAATLFEAQRVTIREIPNCNDSDDPIEDSESEMEMLRRAGPLRKAGGRMEGVRGRGGARGARGARGRGATGRARARRQGRG